MQPLTPHRKWLFTLVPVLILTVVIFFVLTQCGTPQSPTAPAPASAIVTTTNTDFINPEVVTLQGYSGPQEDPVISPDNEYLFFDSHNDTGELSYLYYAKRIDYKTFKFIGRIPGVNYPGIEGVEDTAHNFYFVSPVFLKQGGLTIGHGIFANGSVTSIAPVRGISLQPAPSGRRALNFDLYITPDGNTLYFSDFMIDESDAKLSVRGVKGAQLAIATRNADGFTRLSNSDDILKNVNALGQLVYNATPSVDGLELAFNASPSFPVPSHIYIATRPSPSATFGKPQLVVAADLDPGQLSEPGSFSPDGKNLYFHRVMGPATSQIYVLTRNR
jgi:WD40-like Beta Propeller Repeat